MTKLELTEKEADILRQMLTSYEFHGTGDRCAQYAEIWGGIMGKLMAELKPEGGGTNGEAVHG